MNIAVLEDNPAISEYLTIALEMAGHHVTVYTQGTSLLEALFPERGVCTPLLYDIITVDLLLPGSLSGVEVIARIRDSIAPEQLPIIVISGASHLVFAQVKKSFPDVVLLEKPFQMKVLLQLLETLKRSQEK